MSYSCADAYSDLTQALNLRTPPEWDDDGDEHVSEETDLALAEIARLQAREADLLTVLTALETARNFIADRSDEWDDEEDHLIAVLDEAIKASKGKG